MAQAPTCVWTWPAGATEPVEAASLQVEGGRGQFAYTEAYRELAERALALDPVHLRISRRDKGQAVLLNGGFPGVVVDAMPSGYGADRLNAIAGRDLSAFELFAAGPPDGAGAIEVCDDIEAKLARQPETVDRLIEELRKLDDDEPHSRALRRLGNHGGTSAGGERPKVTLVADGRQWLAKMQARGDVPHLPAREFVAMNLARELQIRVPETRLIQEGGRSIYLIERFDRAGDPHKPQRHLFASAHSVLGLDGPQTKDDPRRSYLVLADEMRRWQQGSPHCEEDIRELWRRMVFNVLVGNSDDHPRNHALINDGRHWRLSPAFDITPLAAIPGTQLMALDEAGGWKYSAQGVLGASSHFGLAPAEAVRWMTAAAAHVDALWRERLASLGIPAAAIDAMAPTFLKSAEIAGQAMQLENLASELGQQKRRSYKRR
ncbi:MAG TPA: type II toxin-antitoxin system HipA family toxin [Ramlibacter sp.]|nr:type II toxin-antitoxin system HipA family toxin [Ramlibacter sp.]